MLLVNLHFKSLIPEFQVCIYLPMAHLETGSSLFWTCYKADLLRTTLLFFLTGLCFCCIPAQQTGLSSADDFSQSCLCVTFQESQ